MRHKIAGNRLNRNRSLRKATLRDLAKATIKEERICTTKAKAKEARKLVEKLITMGKGGSLADKRRAFSILCDHQVVSDLFNKTSPRFKNRLGGYTRIIPLGTRRGDNAEMVYLELTEKAEVIVSVPKAATAGKKSGAKATTTSQPEVSSAKPAGSQSKKKEKTSVVEDAEVVEEPKAEVSEKKEKKSAKGTAEEKSKVVGGIKNLFKKKQK